MSRKGFIFISATLFIVLIFRYWQYSNSVILVGDGDNIHLSTRIRSDPEIRNGKQRFILKLENGQRVHVTTGLGTTLKYGDRIQIDGIVREKNYDDYSLLVLNFPDIQIETIDQNFVARLGVLIRKKADNIYQKSLPPASAGLLSGIIFGGDRNLPDRFSEDLRASGVTHVIAASGMNVTFVASFLMGLSGFFLRRQIAITIAIFGIFFYTLIAGFEPSIVRAAIMGSIVFSSRLIGRESFAISSLTLTVYSMLFYSPVFLYDVGFQLSVMATLGIVLFKPLLDIGFSGLGIFGKLGKEDIGTTIAAQITTLPILLGTFGSVSSLSILVNALVLWTIPILMVIGALGLFIGVIIEPLGEVIVLTAAPLLFYFEKVVTLFAKFESSVSISYLSTSAVFGYYMILGAILLFMNKAKLK